MNGYNYCARDRRHIARWEPDRAVFGMEAPHGRGRVRVLHLTVLLSRGSFARRRSRSPPRVPPYLSELIEHRDVDREAFYDRLRRNGPRSYEEFKHAERLWAERE